MTPNTKAKIRLLIAALIAPIISAVLVGLVFLEPGQWRDVFPAIVPLMQFGALIGWPAMIIFGLPLHALISRMNRRHWFVYGCLGAIVGGIAGFAFGTLAFGAQLPSIYTIRLVLFAGIPTGALAAIIFHLIRGPIQSPAPPPAPS